MLQLPTRALRLARGRQRRRARVAEQVGDPPALKREEGKEGVSAKLKILSII